MGSNKIIYVGLAVAVAVTISYFMFFRGDGTSGLTLTTGSGAAELTFGAQADKEFLHLLNQLEAIKLDKSIFSDPVFRSLVDFRREPAPQPVGRANPFAPLSR